MMVEHKIIEIAEAENHICLFYFRKLSKQG